MYKYNLFICYEEKQQSRRKEKKGERRDKETPIFLERIHAVVA